MNIKKEISRKNVGGKCQILVCADVSRTVRPSLKTGIYIRPELFDAESGNVIIPRQSRRNADVVKEAEEGQRLLQSFCVTLLSICQEKASELEVCISKEWLQLQLSSIVQHNSQLTNAIQAIAADKTPKHKTTKLVAVETPVVSPDADSPRYEKQDFYRLLIQYCERNNICNPVTGQYESRPICDIVSSHMARRTFIGVAYRLTHDPNLIGKMTGHVEGSQAFNRYRKIEDEDLRSVTNLL